MRYLFIEAKRRLKAIKWNALFGATKRAGRALFKLFMITWLLDALFVETLRTLLEPLDVTQLGLYPLAFAAFIFVTREFHLHSLLEHARIVSRDFFDAVADMIVAIRGRS